MNSEHTRRSVLRTAGAVLAGAVGAGSVVTPADAAADTEAGRIPAPFDALPRIDEPDACERDAALHTYPSWAVPDEGPVPDWSHQQTVERPLVLEPWVFEAAGDRLVARAASDRHGEVDRSDVEAFIFEYAYIRERFLTPDGRDAVEVLLDDLEEETDGRR